MIRPLVLSSLVSLVTLALYASGCGGDSNQPPPNNANNPPPSMTGGPPPGPATGAPPPATATGATPTGVPGWPPAGGGAPSGPMATPVDPNVAAAATALLGTVAASQAPGMQKDGPGVAGQFAEGQVLEGAFQFVPGKCYTLVAAGVGIQQLDVEVFYTTPIPGLNPSIGKGTPSGATTTMGGGGNCLKPLSPLAAPAKFVVRASKGAGLAAAQLYSK
jgi:hypothetical protein